MKEVRVTTRETLATIRDNRAKHADTYDAAVRAYYSKLRLAVDAALSSLLAPINTGLDGAAELEVMKSKGEDAVRHIGRIHPPQNHLEDYDRVIAMLESSVDEVITLSAAEFDQFVRDQWHWTREFQQSTSSYLGK